MFLKRGLGVTMMMAALAWSACAQDVPAPAPATPPQAGAPAQQPDAGPGGQAPSAPTPANTLTRNVRLAVLDAVVVDSKGNAVRDVKREEFQIYDNGVLQTIRNFDPPGRYTLPPATDIESTGDLDRLAPRMPVNIIALDEFNTLFEDEAFARYSIEKYLKSQPEHLDTPTMLVAVTLDKFTVLRDYTQNRQALIDAMNHHFVAYPWQATQGQWRGERVSTAILALRRTAEATNGHFGHKNLIWVGRGFPASVRLKLASDEQSAVQSALVRTINELRDARVTLYTIDPAGVQTDPFKYGEAAGLFEPFGGNGDFESIAHATGGRGIHGRNDVDVQVGTAVGDSTALYTLVYRPSEEVQGGHNDYHKIKVTVTRPGLTVVTRQGYYPERGVYQLRQDGTMGRNLKAELYGAQTSNMVYDAVPFTVTAKGDPEGTFLLKVGPAGVPWITPRDGGPRQTTAIVLVTTFDKKDKQLDQHGMQVTAKAPESAGTGPIRQPVGMTVKVAPNAKAVRARFVVRMSATGKIGTVDYPLDGSTAEIGSRGQDKPAGTPTASAPEAPPAPAARPQP